MLQTGNYEFINFDTLKQSPGIHSSREEEKYSNRQSVKICFDDRFR
jgi:hypothetical protein